MVEPVSLIISIAALIAQMKVAMETNKREKQKIRLLKEQAENTKNILKLLEDKQRLTPFDHAAMDGTMVRSLKTALDDISSSPMKSADELGALEKQMSSIMHQYHQIHRETPPAMMHCKPSSNVVPVGGGGNGGWDYITRQIVETAQITVQGVWYVTHNLEEVLHLAQLAQQVADLLMQPAFRRAPPPADEQTWSLVNDLRHGVEDARWIVWYSQWHHLSNFPPPNNMPCASTSAHLILQQVVEKMDYCLNVLPAVISMNKM